MLAPSPPAHVHLPIDHQHFSNPKLIHSVLPLHSSLKYLKFEVFPLFCREAIVGWSTQFSSLEFRAAGRELRHCLVEVNLRLEGFHFRDHRVALLPQYLNTVLQKLLRPQTERSPPSGETSEHGGGGRDGVRKKITGVPLQFTNDTGGDTDYPPSARMPAPKFRLETPTLCPHEAAAAFPT